MATKRLHRSLILSVVLLQGIFAALLAAEPEEVTTDICENIHTHGPESLELSDSERNLVCGDPESENWQQIPFNQAEYFLRAFLQGRGYHSPHFEIRENILHVFMGEKTYITHILSEGLPEQVNLGKKRKVRGEVLIPGELDGLTGWVRSSLQARGYGCPRVDLQADAATGEIMVRVDTGPLHHVESIEQEDSGGIDPLIFRRFYAFQFGKPLDMRWLNLSATRIVQEELFLSAYYDLSCTEEGKLTIFERVQPAKPSLITLGVGVETEGLVRGRAQYKQSRLGEKASSIEVTTEATVREQVLSTQLQWYVLDDPSSRFHLLPNFEARRTDEENYEYFTADIALEPATSRDNQFMRVEVQGGPVYHYEGTISGVGPASSFFLSLDSRTELMTHLFEYFIAEPQSGWQATLETSSRINGFLSDLNAHYFLLDAQSNWNLGRFDPPFMVLSWRGFAGTTLASDGTIASDIIPVSMRFYIGGDADIRGFSRKELPFHGRGFYTALYNGIELRAGDVLPLGIQPFILLDVAKGGDESFHLAGELYWSPGFGVRWKSPFGVVRASLAHGFIENGAEAQDPEDEHLQFFASFGQEF